MKIKTNWIYDMTELPEPGQEVLIALEMHDPKNISKHDIVYHKATYREHGIFVADKVAYIDSEIVAWSPITPVQETDYGQEE